MSTRIKPPSTSVIAALSEKKRALLDEMLFEKNLSYRRISAISKAKFGVLIHAKSLSRYYQKRAPQRTMERIVNSRKSANSVVKAFTDNPADTYQAILNVIGQIAFDTAMDSPDEVQIRAVRELTALLISARREDVHSKRFLLSREKWEFDVARTCAQHIVDLQAIMADKSVDEDARLHAIRKRLFGENLPD